MQEISETGTIDITPKWQGLMGLMVDVLQNPKASQEAKDGIRGELLDLAKHVDELNQKNKEKQAR